MEILIAHIRNPYLKSLYRD